MGAIQVSWVGDHSGELGWGAIQMSWVRGHSGELGWGPFR